MENNDKKYLLWTGGWDSTFRLCELSRKNITVQPIYVNDFNRKSRTHETESMCKILGMLKNRSTTVAHILPIITVNLQDIPKNDEITRAYEIIHKETNLGPQHEWLARLAVLYPGIEMGTEAGSISTSHILHAIDTYCVLEELDGIKRLNKEKSTHEGLLVLGNVSFPIIDKTEQDMVKLIKEWEMEDIMENIWFCHTPLKQDDKSIPCGICHPCQLKLASNMGFLLPQKSKIIAVIYKSLENLFGTKATNKLFSFIMKNKI